MPCRIDKRDVTQLKKMYKTGTMSPHLKKAVGETIKAINKGDCDLAFELSAVKSYITGAMDVEPKKNHFREDSDKNMKKFKTDFYRVLDSIHHDASYAVDKIPSGMMMFTSGGKMYQKGRATVKHPIVKMMEAEHRAIIRDVKRRKR